MEEIELKDFFKVLKKKWYVIVIASIMCALIAFIYGVKIKVPMYETNTTLVLVQSNENATSSTISQNDLAINQKLVSTYSELIKSRRVLTSVIDELELDYKVSELGGLISVESVESTEILKITVKNEDPEMAKNIANKTALSFIKEVSEIYNLNNVSIIDEATTPKTVANNTTLRDTAIAFILGLALSTGIIFVIYYFDDTIKFSDSLEEELQMPIIGKIGMNDVKKKENLTNTELIVNKYPKSLISEGIKTLRTNLQFSSVDKEFKSLLITSSIPGEGKSFITANLAIAFCQTGKNVLIVDCDMRKGRQHKIFNISNKMGLSNLLIDDLKNLNNGYIKNTEIKNLLVLPCGTIPPNPSELLNSDKNKELIKLLEEKFDIVIFDGVPCNGLPDSIIMSTLIDKTLIVSAESKTPKTLLENTKKSLENVNANIAGDVLNKIDMNDSKIYGKYYSYYGDKE